MSQLQLDQAHLRSWVGRTETMTDVIDPGRAAAMAATLDLTWSPEHGDRLPHAAFKVTGCSAWACIL